MLKISPVFLKNWWIPSLVLSIFVFPITHPLFKIFNFSSPVFLSQIVLQFSFRIINFLIEVLGLNFTLFCTLASKTVSTTPNAYMNIVPIIESVQDLNFKSCILVFPRDGSSCGTSRDKQKFNFDQLIKKCTLSFIHDFYKKYH